MEVHPDFKELLELFNAHEVEYLVVGGLALALHGAPRYTGDMDLYVRPSPDNARKIMAALTAFGFGSAGIATDDFLLPGRVIQLGFPPVRIDLTTSISGVSWEEACRNKVVDDYGGVSAPFIGRNEFMANKAATGRKKDLGDLEALEKRPPGRPGNLNKRKNS
jgi:hypothetical protein